MRKYVCTHLLLFEYFHGMKGFGSLVLRQHDATERTGAQSSNSLKVVQGGRVLNQHNEHHTHHYTVVDVILVIINIIFIIIIIIIIMRPLLLSQLLPTVLCPALL